MAACDDARGRISSIIGDLIELIPQLATLPEVSDADMALMYLRHLAREVGFDTQNVNPIQRA